jgi:hypothetical protein
MSLDLDQAFLDGRSLTCDEAVVLASSRSVDDLVGSAKLLGYYCRTDRLCTELAEHVTWIVTKIPESPLAGLTATGKLLRLRELDPDSFQQIRKIWLEEVKSSNDVRVLTNSTYFFLICEETALVMEILEHMLRIDSSLAKSVSALKKEITKYVELRSGHKRQFHRHRPK